MDIKIYAKNLESSAVGQIDALCNCSAFQDAKIRIMPDAHAGKGCVIGFTADLKKKVVPSLVGVDVGCGVLAAKIKQPVKDFEAFDRQVKRTVPSGFNLQRDKVSDTSSLGLYCFKNLKNVEKLDCSLGTLGGGNHYIELDTDDKGDMWLNVHTGSRNLGLQVAQYYQKLANQVCEDNVPYDLKYLEGQDAQDYLHDMWICQRWAMNNRIQIAKNLEKHSRISYIDMFQTVHNYIGNDEIVRKGAISAEKHETVIIPLNMRDGAVIGEGLGNQDWNCSAPHGAGRSMSRTAAKNSLNVTTFKEEMRDAGIFTTTAVSNTVDEAPEAYKPTDEILELMKPTVKANLRLKPVYNFKDTSGGSRRR